MNQRIKELAEQAGFMEAWFSESGDFCGHEIKKFAELILQEIIEELEADVIDMDDDPTDYERGYDDGVKNSVAHIKDHFGVEE
jgi:hypothetical protein